jgi:glycolate oxidase iron-sulfur subunit
MALGVETLASRGRVDTVRGLLSGQLKLTSRMEEILSMCLLCKACEAACPPGIVSHRIILEGRRRVVTQKGLPLAKRLAFRRLLKDRRALGRALGVAAALQTLGPEAGRGRLRHLPTLFSGLAGGRALPPLARRCLRDRIPEVSPPAPGVAPRGRVALCSGCYLEFVDSPVGDAALRVLTGQGWEVIFPRAQVCCGAPVLLTGDVEDGLELVRRNAGAFADTQADAVLTLCATCGSTLREEYRSAAELLPSGERARVEALSERIQDLARFLVANPPLEGLTLPQPLGVTYHDPCHHARGMGVRAEPRELLGAIQGVELLEMVDPARCCGGGGSFSMTHPEISVEVGSWKVRDILSTGARAVVTSCPGCILQIQEVASRLGADFEVLHLVELLDRAMPSTRLMHRSAP